ncbi:hypothetical protein [Phytoactinopolyspora endophytica]|uniref:hypothetical protein n=1 Tax=Phytoactinopolyspora endophytica TaxID=1642495 RepID=UPI0013E9A608|nr:hypothetical protein [Phytoactinopolyspora endophytica]
MPVLAGAQDQVADAGTGDDDQEHVTGIRAEYSTRKLAITLELFHGPDVGEVQT